MLSVQENNDHKQVQNDGMSCAASGILYTYIYIVY